MSERDRQRRLHVENRLAELRAKYGRELEQAPLAAEAEDWVADIEVPEPPPPRAALSAAEAMRKLDSYGETALFSCPRCGEESAKASVAIDAWHCTACSSGGKASRLVNPEQGPTGPGW